MKNKIKTSYLEDAVEITKGNERKWGLYNQLQKGMLYCLIDIAFSLREISARTREDSL